jgi:TPR repeat protein
MLARSYGLWQRYAVGEAVPYNAAKATYCYTEAAKQGHAEVQNEIEEIWFDGESCEIDFKKTIYWYKESTLPSELQ